MYYYVGFIWAMGKNIISNDVFFSYVGFGIDHDRYLQHLTFFFFGFKKSSFLGELNSLIIMV